MPELLIGLVLGFVSRLLYDELKSPRVRIVSESIEAFQIGPISQVPGGFDNDYNAYRIKAGNHQKGFLDCAAENCVAWLHLDSAPEAYQLSWVGGASELTLNVGDIREVDICARGTQTGVIIAPTEIGYSKSSLRKIGDGSRDLHGRIRITCRNGKKAEKGITLRPAANCQLDIS